MKIILQISAWREDVFIPDCKIEDVLVATRFESMLSNRGLANEPRPSGPDGGVWRTEGTRPSPNVSCDTIGSKDSDALKIPARRAEEYFSRGGACPFPAEPSQSTAMPRPNDPSYRFTFSMSDGFRGLRAAARRG